MTDPVHGPEPDTPLPPEAPRLARWRDGFERLSWTTRASLGAAAVALLVAGAAGGVASAALLRPEAHVFQPGLVATPIAEAADANRWIALEGDVVEIFGNKFVIDDGVGRALVETGRAGEDQSLVMAGERVTVQGRFDHGFLHAGAIRRADGDVETLAPPPPPGPPPVRRP